MNIRYALYDGRFTRTIQVCQDRDYTNEQIGDQISSFIQIFDKLMKRYVAGSLGAREIEQMYLEYLNKGVGLI